MLFIDSNISNNLLISFLSNFFPLNNTTPDIVVVYQLLTKAQENMENTKRAEAEKAKGIQQFGSTASDMNKEMNRLFTHSNEKPILTTDSKFTTGTSTKL